MKKLTALLLVVVMAVCVLASCNLNDVHKKGEGVMTYAEYEAAAIDSEVVIEAFVQATQSWWNNKITVYLQDKDGGYFAYELACSEADAAKLVKGQKIKVTGTKGAWAGEVEIMDGTFEVLEGNWVAKATDLTAKIADEEALLKNQNKLVSFKALTVKAIEYKNGEPGDDIYLTLSKDGKDYNFCVERYLTDPESAVYTTVGTLVAGDVVDVEGFLYWYEGMNPHVTSIVKK
jgi:hypothetical protein